MSYLQRLILNQRGELPLVRPRIPGRYENYTPGDAESSTGPVPNSAVKQSKYTPINHSFNTEHNISQPEDEQPPLLSGNAILKSINFEKHKEPKVEKHQDSEDKKNKEHLYENKDGFKTGNLEDKLVNNPDLNNKPPHKAEGILVERHLLSQEFHQPIYQEVKRPIENNSPFIAQGSFHQMLKKPNIHSQEESIQVNIGTVEVRAIMEKKDKSQRKPPERKPKMSLQEYLDHKNKPGS